MQRASWEVVRYALAIFMFISLCTLLSFVALCFLFRPSIHTGAPYDRIGSIAPVYVIRRTSRLSPQLILADFECVNDLHAFPRYVVCMLIEIKTSVNGNT